MIPRNLRTHHIMANTTKTTKTTKRLRNKVRIQPIRSRDELAAVAIAIADLTIERDKTAASRDERLAEVADGFNVRLEALEDGIAQGVKRLRAHAVANRDTLFGDRQSIRVAGHELRFRKGSGKVAYNAGVKAGDALDALLAAEDEARVDQFAKVTVALDKHAILRAWRESGELRGFLEGIGIRVVVEEEFSFVPNREDGEAVGAGEKDTTLAD